MNTSIAFELQVAVLAFGEHPQPFLDEEVLRQ